MARYEITPELTRHELDSITAYARAIERLPLGFCARCGAQVRLFTQQDMTDGRLCRVCIEADRVGDAIYRLRRDARAREWNGDHDEETNGER
jgi:hypothetical protein